MYGRPPTGSLSNRPASRATSTWGKQNPPTSSGRAPPTRIGTAFRGPPKTGAGRINFNDRPTTQQGLAAVGRNLGPGRQIQDATYFQTLLRQKQQQLDDEIQRINVEIGNSQKDASNMATFEKKADSLAQELRELQGQLGDLNTLVDKLHTDTSLADFEKEYQKLQAKNTRTSQLLDEIFLEKQRKEGQLKNLEAELDAQDSLAEKQVQLLDDDKKTLYIQLKTENMNFVNKITEKQQQLEEIVKKIGSLEEQIVNDSQKQAALDMVRKISMAKSKTTELEMYIATAKGESASQEKTRLLEQVKSDNLELSGMERKVQSLENDISALKQQLAIVTGDLDAQAAEKYEKYKELVTKEKEMVEFLDKFDQLKTTHVTEIEKLEEEVESNLVEIQNLGAKCSLGTGTKKELEGMAADLQNKTVEVERAENTIEALAQERNQKMSDLEKVAQLEVKIATEVENLNEKMSKMKQDLVRYDNSSETQAKLKIDIEEKSRLSVLFQDQTKELNQVVDSLMSQYDSKRSLLKENDTFKQLLMLEMKIQALESQNAELSDYVEKKSAESNYIGIKGQVLSTLDSVNSQTIKIKQLAPTR